MATSLLEFIFGETPISSDKLNRIIRALTGANNTPIALTGVNEDGQWALSVKNGGVGGKGIINYAPDGSVLFQVDDTSGVQFKSGGVLSAPVTAAGTQDLTAKTYAATKAGAVAGARFVGGTASGAPASGTFAVGDFVIDQTGKVWICTVAGTPGTWVSVGPSTSSANLGADVALTLANTYYDGPSVALTAGTWLAQAHGTFLCPSGQVVTMKLWDGATVIASCEEGNAAGVAARVSLACSGIATPAGAATYKVSAACTGAGGTMTAAAANNGAGNNATGIRALRTA